MDNQSRAMIERYKMLERAMRSKKTTAEERVEYFYLGQVIVDCVGDEADREMDKQAFWDYSILYPEAALASRARLVQERFATK